MVKALLLDGVIGMEKTKVEVTLEEIKLFDVHRRIREALERFEKEFPKYKIDEINAGIELGFPSGVKGSLSVTLKK
jgi:hypothetical protein